MTRDPKSDRLPSWIWLWAPLVIAIALAIVPHIDWEWYKTWIVSERRGVLETSEFLVALAGFLMALGMLAMPELHGRPWIRLWIGVAALSLFYVAGEEISWGQNYLGWETPESWMSVNDQGETNLHNTSSWFDQKPRALLELAVVIGF